MIIINESGLYSVILRSRKPEAKRFKKWVTSEVLPTIRKTGIYAVASAQPASQFAIPETFSEALRLAADAIDHNKRLEQQIIADRPKVQALERIASADGMENITNPAKALQVRPKDLFGYLSANRWIYRRQGGKGWIAYQERIQQGVLTHKVTTIQASDGTERMVESVLVTPKGVAKLAQVFSVEEVAA